MDKSGIFQRIRNAIASIAWRVELWAMGRTEEQYLREIFANMLRYRCLLCCHPRVHAAAGANPDRCDVWQCGCQCEFFPSPPPQEGLTLDELVAAAEDLQSVHPPEPPIRCKNECADNEACSDCPPPPQEAA